MNTPPPHSHLPDDIIAQAAALLDRAYAPYSHFHVASIIKARGIERLFYGCNVENVSFGATICAERSAIMQMIAMNGRADLEWVVVMSDIANPVPPCGMCLQVLAEFGSDNLPIYLANRSGVQDTLRLGDALPRAFRTFAS